MVQFSTVQDFPLTTNPQFTALPLVRKTQPKPPPQCLLLRSRHVPPTLPRPALPVSTTPPIEASSEPSIWAVPHIKPQIGEKEAANKTAEHPDILMAEDGGHDNKYGKQF